MDKDTAARMVRAIEAEIARIRTKSALAKMKAELAFAVMKEGVA